MSSPVPTHEAGEGRVVRELHSALLAAGSTVAVAESLTGGLLALVLTEAPGASEVFVGSVTAYTNGVKHGVLGVDSALLERHGAVNAEVARQMAAGVRRLMGSTYALSTTGVAGPQPQDGRPVGTVFLGLADAHGTRVVSPQLRGDRHTIQQRCVDEALRLLQTHLRPSP
ncbi:CinA family protein [Kitasatospora sp. NPDC127059]|uniref:CinA family protein n=1 Tax=unclassified Kitasatospora TaxID=2633591 RepID=UPI003668F776